MKQGLGVFLLLLLAAQHVFAAVTGDCVNCHTMHNSQDGNVVLAAGPNESLTNLDCIGCHSSAGSATINTIGASRVPIVYNHTAPASPLAGGNFFWVAENGDNYGHNVFGIVGQDQSLAVAPGAEPGIESLADCSVCHAALEKGCKSCHWPRHHAAGDGGVADQSDGWYRFLGSAMDAVVNPDNVATAPGVTGVEEADWEQSPSSTVHNVYKGTSTVYGNGGSYYPSENSIGSFCAGCHEKFHNSIVAGPSAIWIRHPSDVVLPNRGEYADYTTYNPLVPVAKQSLDGTVSSSIAHDEDVVTCLSCHRAHGSPYPDMLRWDYQNECISGRDSATCGCMVCHTAKDAI